MKVTILICSSGRRNVLLSSISSIVSQAPNIPLVVVENGQKVDLTLNKKLRQFNNIKVYHEPLPGLSRARNTGINKIDTEWILFLDDDIQLPPGFFDPLKRVIDTNRFDCFGGYYLPFYPEGKPEWLPESFGKKSLLRDTTGSIDIFRDGCHTACILCVRKKALVEVGVFKTNLGMGSSIGYGEEDDLQIRLQNAGYKLGFIADWWLYHAVLSHKHEVRWHLKSAFARGRDGQRIHNKWNQRNAFYRLIKGSGGVIYRLFKHGTWVATKKKYYWQNFVVDVFGPFFNICGRFYSTFFY